MSVRMTNKIIAYFFMLRSGFIKKFYVGEEAREISWFHSAQWHLLKLYNRGKLNFNLSTDFHFGLIAYFLPMDSANLRL